MTTPTHCTEQQGINGFFAARPAQAPTVESRLGKLVANPIPLGPIKTWSYSAVKTYETCPLRLKYSRIDRVPKADLPNDNPMVRGNRIHAEIEDYINTGTPIPTKLRSGHEIIERCREEFLNNRASTELLWTFDQNWINVEPQSPDVWLRVILDVFIKTDENIAHIIDWKTGKSWLKDLAHTQQGQLYAISAFEVNPQLDIVDTSFVYVDEKDKVVNRSYNRVQANLLRTSFHNRGVRLTTETQFLPKPNSMNCKWCDYGMLNGIAHCIYDVNRKDAIRPATGHLRGRTVKHL